VRDVGPTRDHALAAAVSPAHGWAALGADGPRRLLSAAPGAAMIEAASMGPHTALYEAVAKRKDGRIVFRLVADADTLRKASAPPDPTDVLDRLVTQLAGQLRRETAAWSAPRIREYLRALDVEWGKASAAEINRAFARADAVMRRASIETLARPWVARVEAQAKLIAGETRAWIRAVHLPRINMAFGQEDRAAIRQVAAQQGWFLRDAHFRISDTMTAQGRKIVERGLRDGLGTDVVARRLRAEIPDLYVRRAGNYALACASVGMQRARSWSMAASYSDAGIEYYQITAVLDERTTDTCFDGDTLISVPRGERKISEVNPGDSVITGSGRVRMVVAVSKRVTQKLLRLHLSSGRHILVTGNHCILTPGGWRRADEIAQGGIVASQGNTETRGVGRKDLPELRKDIRGAQYLRETRTDEILLDGVPERSPAVGIHGVGSCKDMRGLRQGIPCPSEFGESRKEKGALLDRVSQAPCCASVRGLRKGVRIQAEHSIEPEVLRDRLPGAFERHDQVGVCGCECDTESRCHGGTRTTGRQVFHRFSDPVHDGCRRGGRELLARQKDERCSVEGAASKGAQDRGSWLRPGENFTEGSRRAHTGQARERSVEEYLRCSGGTERVTRIEHVRGQRYVYNLQVEDDPTYIAEGVVVHNCRYLDGQVISVGDARQAMARANAITNPEDIYQESPFVRTVREGDRRYLRTGRGDTIAEIHQSGVGTRVDAQNRAPVGTHNGGVYGGRVAGNQLVDKGIGFPPFHHLCRSTTVPVLGPVQVPRGHTPVAVPGPPIRPPTPPAVPPPGPGAYAIPPRLDRPVVAVPTPRRGTPAPFGAVPSEGADPYMRPGLLDGIALEEQVRQRVRDAVLVLNEGVLAARATRAGRALRKPKLGGVLREGLAVEAKRRAPDPALWALSRRTGLPGQLAEREARALYAEPLSWLSPRFAGRVPTLPPLVTDPGPLGWTGNVIRLPRGTNAVQGRFLHRALAEWLDGMGANGAAGAMARDEWRTGGGPLFTLPDGARVERGRWGDVLTGARWPEDPERALVSGVAMHAVAPRMAAKLATLWEANPAHVGFLLAWLQGAFL